MPHSLNLVAESVIGLLMCKNGGLREPCAGLMEEPATVGINRPLPISVANQVQKLVRYRALT